MIYKLVISLYLYMTLSEPERLLSLINVLSYYSLVNKVLSRSIICIMCWETSICHVWVHNISYYRNKKKYDFIL